VRVRPNGPANSLSADSSASSFELASTGGNVR